LICLTAEVMIIQRAVISVLSDIDSVAYAAVVGGIAGGDDTVGWLVALDTAVGAAAIGLAVVGVVSCNFSESYSIMVAGHCQETKISKNKKK